MPELMPKLKSAGSWKKSRTDLYPIGGPPGEAAPFLTRSGLQPERHKSDGNDAEERSQSSALMNKVDFCPSCLH
jgi:hypothetical protein